MPPLKIKLVGVPDADRKLLTEQLTINLEAFFDWSLLEAGGYEDVHIDPTDALNDSTLLPVHMPSQPDGRIWQAPHRNWVWESGLDSDRQPIPISGVYLGGVLHPQDGSYYINYPEGRVVFNDPISTTTVVQVEYSYKWMNFYNQTVPWFRDVIFDAYRFEVGPDAQPSGFVGLLKQNSVQLPAIVIETGGRRSVPRQLGNLSQWTYQDFLFHVLAENVEDRDFMIDVFSNQKDSSIDLFDENARAAANAFALDWHGAPVPEANHFTYPNLITNYPLTTCYFNKIVIQEVSAILPLFRSVIRITLEI